MLKTQTIIKDPPEPMDVSIFDKISKASTTKEEWDILERCFIGGEKIRKVWLQALKRQYGLL